MSQYEQDKDKEKEDESSSSSFQILQGGPSSSSATAVAESEGGEGGSGSGIIGGTTTGAAQKRVQLATCYFVDERFKGNANPDPSQKKKVAKWRMKQRMKTVSVALVMCLNIGVDPPDVIKTSPCARLECWIDPFSQPSEKALDLIGKTLQQQYERWQPRARYKQCMDPTVEDVKKLCLSLRRNAKEERVLFHYNGHGVPRPTSNGELWVFNKNFTQYIPLSIYELQTWMGSPSIYIFDCSSAGLILQWFNQFAEQREHEQQRRGVTNLAIKDYILLAACGADELLPMNPELPQDVFTACLTTPIKIALQWFCSHSIVKGVTPAMVDKLPGRLNDRKTPLGELNWIFTAVTDTIAWNVLPRDLFQKLFRQDLLVASLFRNFLLAERIMRSANCNPTSWPVLPPTYQHPMWQAWDLAADVCLSQLPKLLQDPNAEFQPNPFFAEQLTAFEVWLEFASEKKRPPEQLPIVLQVLLSQAHRLRALVLLSKFLDAGPWAVNLALSVGIFPYVLKLLQSPAVELRQTLVFIWAKILALDKSCQLDLVKDNGHNYFISVLDASNVSSELRTMAAFVLTVITDNCRPGQSACLSGNLIPICLAHLPDADPLLRRWLCLCLGKLWQQYDEAKRVAIKENAHKRLCALLTDPIPEVRAAAVYALGTFMGGTGKEQAEIELNLVVTLPVVTADASAMVRKELVITLSRLVQIYEEECKEVAVDILQELVRRRQAELLQESEAKAAAKGSRKGKKSSIIIGSITAPKKKGSRLDIATSTSRRRSSSSAPTSASTSPSDIHSDSSLASSSVSSEEMDPSTASSTPTSHHHGGEGTDSSRTRSFHRGHQRQLSKQQSSVYGCLWKMVLSLESDPFPEVARLAGVLVESVHHQLDANLVRTANSLSSSSSTASSSVMSNSITIGDGDGASGSSPQSTTSSPSFSSSLPHQLKAKAASVSNVGFIRRYAPSTSNLLGLASPKPASQGSKRKSGDGTSVSPPDHGASSSLSSSPNGSSSVGSGAGDAASTSSSSSLSSIAGEHGLELESVFYAWSCQYFSQPCLRSSDGEDITSPAYSRRLWRHQRHKALLSRAKLSRERGIVPRMEEQIAIMDNRTEMTSLVMFHPLETFVIVSDNKDDISVWDWTVSGGKRQHRFSNTNAAGSRITDMKLCNPHDNAILLTATDDGVMRVWRGFDDAESVELVTAWKALPELASSTSNNGAGMIIEWRQQQGALLTSGDVGIIHVWDVERELATHSFATNGDTCVTSMASHGGAGHVLVAGFGDGAVKLFDCRMSQGSRSSLIASFHEHKKWVVNTVITYVENQILSGSTAGEIKFWDTRKPTSYKTITAELAYMSSFSVHPFAPVIACGSNEQKIQILDMNGSLLHEIKYHEGFLGQRIGPISCLAFHPYETLLAAGATDSIISVYSA